MYEWDGRLRGWSVYSFSLYLVFFTFFGRRVFLVFGLFSFHGMASFLCTIFFDEVEIYHELQKRKYLVPGDF